MDIEKVKESLELAMDALQNIACGGVPCDETLEELLEMTSPEDADWCTVNIAYKHLEIALAECESEGE